MAMTLQEHNQPMQCGRENWIWSQKGMIWVPALCSWNTYSLSTDYDDPSPKASMLVVQ